MTETPQTPAPQEPPQAPAGPGAATPGKNGLALAGMILGIICVATSWIWCFIWGSVACGIVGLILSILGSKKAKETGIGASKAKVGLICSIIGIIIAIVVFVVILAIAGAAIGEAARQTAVQSAP